ncbi:MAG: CBS domain-containing protein [Microcoleaceae cyanobacterium]
MPTYQTPQYSSALKQAINRNPLTVTPDTSLLEVIGLMGQAHNRCSLPNPPTLTTEKEDLSALSETETQGSCVFVVISKPPIASLEVESQEIESIKSMDSTEADIRAKSLVLQGVITERDVVQLIARGMLEYSTDDRWHWVRVGEVMAPSTVNLIESEDQDIFTALSLFRQHQKLNHLPVLTHQGYLAGVVTPERIRKVLQPANILRLRRVEDEMITKVVTASATTSILRTTQMMAVHQTSCVVLHQPIHHTNPRANSHPLTPIGMITAQDVVQAQYLQLDLAQTPAEIMTSSLFCLKPHDSLWYAHQEMQQRKMQRVLVCGESGELLGIITQLSLLRMLDPTEMFRVVRKLQQSVEELQTEKVELLENRAAQLEQQVQERTAKLYEQLQRERLLTKISLQIHQSLNLEDILNTTVAEVQQVLEADRVVIYRLTPEQAGTKVAESVALGWRSLSNETLYSEVIQSYLNVLEIDSVLTLANAQTANSSPTESLYLEAEQIKACLIVPLLEDDQLWGILAVHQCSGCRQWQPSEITLLQHLATQLAIAIQQAQLYRQVKDLNTDLERQVQERTAELQQKVKELQKLNVLKDEFLSTVSHELRTPLANIKMAVHMLKLVPTSDRSQQYISILESECTRETNLINDLLDLQKLEASTDSISLETINLEDWLPMRVTPFHSRTQERQQVLKIQAPSPLPTIQTNSASLERVLAELLNNACKYSPNGGEIVLDIDYYPQKLPAVLTDDDTGQTQLEPDQTAPSTLQFKVSNPVEIPQTELPRIFEKFYRVPNADPWKQGGTGLGLALVEKLVEQLSGTIQVMSQGGMTTFTVELPIEDRG